MTTPLVLSALSLCVSVSCFFFFRWYIRRETSAAKQLEVYRKEVGGLIASIDTVTDRDSLLVEERVKILRKLLEDTDKRMAVYVKELERGRSSEVLYDSLGRNTLDSGPSQQAEPGPEPAPRGEGAKPIAAETPAGGKKQKNKNRRTGPAETAAPENTAPPTGLPPGPIDKSRLKAQIAEMSARGTPAHEIATNLGISVAEVDLALNLLNRPAG
ncbi:MAG: hypothetical protein FWD88_04225 [Treponema sp.]|nr:hypothetical protein [Treponema sp.]